MSFRNITWLKSDILSGRFSIHISPWYRYLNSFRSIQFYSHINEIHKCFWKEYEWAYCHSSELRIWLTQNASSFPLRQETVCLASCQSVSRRKDHLPRIPRWSTRLSITLLSSHSPESIISQKHLHSTSSNREVNVYIYIADSEKEFSIMTHISVVMICNYYYSIIPS